MTPTTTPEPLVCRRCGAQTIPRLSPGTGPHALRANCSDCGAFMQWMSTYSPEERAGRQAQAWLDAMAKLKPTVAQLAYLAALGDRGPRPANRAEASQRIEALRRKRGGVTC
jgi:hypothetical protein